MRKWFSGVVVLLTMCGLVTVSSSAGASDRMPDWVRGEAAVARLGNKLSALAARLDMPAAQLREHLLDDNALFVDGDGLLLYVDPLPAQAPEQGETAWIDTTGAAIVPGDALTLNSRPDAARTIYLDFDGHNVSDTAWNNKTNGSPCYTDAYDSDGQPSVFNETERREIASVWARVAEDYAPFNVNVTTADPGPAKIERTNSGDLEFGTRVVVTNSKTTCAQNKTLYTSVCSNGCGGIAYVGVFNRSGDHGYYQPAFVFQNGVGSSAKNIAEAASHEAGHNLGLSHDGTSTTGYYTGHGSWAPIMGVGYYEAITQWSKGEYAAANNIQDDFRVAESYGAPWIADDHGDAPATATALTSGSATGVIGAAGDRDVFSLTIADTTTATITATPALTSPDLDIKISLQDSNGAQFVVADPSSGSTSKDSSTGMDASLTASLAAGTYYIFVEGAGFADPLSTGYSSYGSVGAYRLTTNTGSTTVDTPPTVEITSPLAGASFTLGTSITFTAAASDGGSDVSSTIVWTSTAGKFTGSSFTTDALPVGSATITATVIDSAGQTAVDTVTVQIVDGSVNPTPTFTGTAVNNGSTWTAIVTSTVSTSGTWSNKGEVGFCTVGTGASSCIFSLTVRKNVGSLTYTDSSIKATITIAKP